MLELETLQTWMQKAICAEVPEKEVHDILTANSKLSARERLNIYVRDFWGRVLDSLAEDFPELVSFWGRKKFDAWMERYVTQYPSTSHTLRDLPQSLEKFLSENYSENDRDLILDYVRFEWAHIQASDAAQLPVLDISQLNESQKNKIDQLPLLFQPHVQLLALNFAVHKSLKARLKPQNTCLVIYRRNFKTFAEKVDPLFFKFLKQLQNDLNLQKTTARLSHVLNAADQQKLEKNLGNWFQNGVPLGWWCQPK